jgi:hypothetical protein
MTENEGGILSAERVAELREKYPNPRMPKTLEEKREADRIRQQKRRARKKAEASGLEEDPDAFWECHIAKADPVKIAAWREQQDYVFELLFDMQLVMDGRASDPKFIALVVEDIESDVAEHGICQMEVYLLEFWKNKNTFADLVRRTPSQASRELSEKIDKETAAGTYLDKWKGDDPTSIFVRFGLVTAIPGHRLHGWREWLASQKPQAPEPLSPKVEWGVLQCACGSLPTAAPVSIINNYREKQIQYRCGQCLRADAPWKEALKTEQSPESQIFDGYGRVKDR